MANHYRIETLLLIAERDGITLEDIIVLYTLMGIALYLVWSHRSLVALFFVQLFFNGLWSVIFFGLKSLFYAYSLG